MVSLHWGTQEVFLPKPKDVHLAHTLIELGVDIIVGHHAHVPQYIEEYRSKPIAYGLGNFAVPKVMKGPAYVNASGEPTQIWQKKQNYWNRVSLGLLWDIENRSWDILEFECTKSVVKKRQFSWPYVGNVDVNSRQYPFRFEMPCVSKSYFMSLESSCKHPSFPVSDILLLLFVSCSDRLEAEFDELGDRTSRGSESYG